MNHDPGPSSSSAARQLPPRPDVHRADDTDGAAGSRLRDRRNVLPEYNFGDRASGGPSSESWQREKQREGLAKKLEFVSHLQKSLDMIVIVYMCIIYYLECSLFRFLLRLIPHSAFLTPKDGLLLPAEQPHIYAIFLPGTLCILSHAFFSLPQAGEATRGYLHGGVIIDFIGQKPPTTRLTLLFFDLMILGLQCLMLAVHRERERLKKAVSPGLPTIGPSIDRAEQPTTAQASTTQDHDAEERGVLRDNPFIADGGDSIELQPLPEACNGREGGSGDEHNRGGNAYSSSRANVDMLDVLRSGNAVLSSFHIIHTVRAVASGVQAPGPAAYSLRTLGYNATLAALAAERRRRLLRGQQRQ